MDGIEMVAIWEIIKMKKVLFGFVGVFALLFLGNCAATTKAPENTSREWMLVEFQDFSKEMMMTNKAKLDLSSIQVPGKFAAHMGCNNMFGNVSFTSNGSVKFSNVGATMMYCENRMDLEAAFGKELPQMTRYKVEGHYLTLTDPKGNQMKFVAADWD